MYSRPSAPRSIGGVLDDSIRLYKACARYWWVPSLLSALVSACVSFYASFALGEQATPALMFSLLRSPVVACSYLVILLLKTWFYCAMVGNINTVFLGGTPPSGSGLADGLKMLPMAVLASILFFLTLFGGTLLLVIPGIYVLGRLQFWIVALMAERNGARAALGSSWRLVKGHWWRAIAIVSMVFIMIVVVSMVFSFVFGLMAVFVRPDRGTALVVVLALGALVNVFVFPAFPAALVATYYDLKLRKDGDDLAARVGDLQPA
jgi:hypothetical protein